MNTMARLIYVELSLHKKGGTIARKEMGIIYMAVNTVNNKVYIGKSIKSLEERKQNHRYEMQNYRETHRHLYRSMNKHGFEAFGWDILEELPDEELSEAEKFWITYYKSIGLPLYNLTVGGDGIWGYHHTEETKAKIGTANKGHIKSQETLRKMSENRKGKWLGHIVSQETREKIGTKNAKTYNVCFISPEGSIYKSVSNLAAFGRSHGVCRTGLSLLIQGKVKQYKGWRLQKEVA